MGDGLGVRQQIYWSVFLSVLTVLLTALNLWWEEPTSATEKR